MEMAAAELGLVSREIDAAVAREVVDDGAPAIRLISASRAGRIELVGGVAVEQVAGFRRPAGRDMADGEIHHARACQHPRLVGRIDDAVIIDDDIIDAHRVGVAQIDMRSEEHTSELQSLMRISYAVFCLKKKT